MKSEITPNICIHYSKVEIEDPDKTVNVPNGSDETVLSNEKWTTMRR